MSKLADNIHLRRHSARHEVEIKAILPIECRRHSRTGVKEEIQVIYLYRDNGVELVGLYPGVTGHENWYLKDLKNKIEKVRRTHVPKTTIFGHLSSWEHIDFSACMGGRSYDGLTITFGDLEDAINQLTKE